MYLLNSNILIFKSYKGYNISKETSELGLWQLLGRPTTFAFRLASYLWGLPYMYLNHLPSLRSGKLYAKVHKKEAGKQLVTEEEVKLYRSNVLSYNKVIYF